MSEAVKRAIFGTFYIIIMWGAASYSKSSYTLLFTILGAISLFEMIKLRKDKKKILALAYILVPFILIHFMPNIYNNEKWTPNLILFIFIITWVFDTFAYLIGVKLGKHKMMPSVSPKKSWEGFFGGFIFSIIAGYLSYGYFKFENMNTSLIISVIIPFTATLGDFIESHYKREAGVKDSGNIIPGHGGILDRMDAFMITIPTIYILINLF
jgi:phosphatidate cytidylyltransferase